MLDLIEKQKALTFFSVLNAVLSMGAYYFLDWTFSGWPVYKILTISTTMPAITLLLLSAGHRRIWSLVRRFDGSFYPDINGKWEGEIQLGDGSGALPLQAHVRVRMFDMAMDFKSSTADSITISMALRTEKGQHHVDYIYRNESKDPSRNPYVGTASLRIESDGGNLIMRGSYFTMRRTYGTIRLRHTNS